MEVLGAASIRSPMPIPDTSICSRQTVRPLATSFGAARPNTGREMLADSIRHKKLRVFRPSVAALGKTDFLFAQRFAVRGCGVLQIWGAVADVTVEDDECRVALGLGEDGQGMLDPINVVGIADSQNIPTVREETRSVSSVKAMRVFPSMVMWLLS